MTAGTGRPYINQVRQIEKAYPALLTWAAQKPALLTDPLLPTLARQGWAQTWQRVQTWTSHEQVLTDLQTMQNETVHAAEGYWTVLEETPEWRTLQVATQVILGAENAIQEAARLATPDEFVQAYQKAGGRPTKCTAITTPQSRQPSDLPALTRWVTHFYTNYLDQTNLRWTNAIKESRFLAGFRRIPSAARAAQALWSGQGRQAIFIIDALRYELAME